MTPHQLRALVRTSELTATLLTQPNPPLGPKQCAQIATLLTALATVARRAFGTEIVAGAHDEMGEEEAREWGCVW